MIVSVVSMPEGIARRTPVSEARERLAEARFLFVDAELPEEAPPGEQPVAATARPGGRRPAVC
ncbi:hypothetical protein OG429_08240 [Streptomyces sp. NBC_00190]|uniref:hypothetical protein n=1 Tax=unclassified Streptomyces TaxID=2593676 RepID=UPI002E2C2DA2|nr:hypothetical protein [Streptomyces sp. NBC_00190]WSZ39328.1 hypothetical protein OG239_11235 [Streptomyces sp. NBC_00868]